MQRKILMIVAPAEFRDEELLVPRQVFEAQGWTVDTVSTRTGEATGMLGHKETVAHDIAWAQEQADQHAYDAVVVVGGMGSPEFLWENGKVHALLQTINRQNKVVSAICLSGCVVAKARLLKGRKATVWEMPGSLEVFKVHGVDYTGEPVTVDGNIVTANGPDAAQAFADAVIAQVNALSPLTTA